MSGAVAVTTAAVAIGIAAEVGTTFAVIAAVGATVGAVGAVTGIKELKYAGMALGAVGAIGSLASMTGAFAEGGLFGAEAASMAGAATDAGSWGASGASAASDAAAGAGGIEAEIANWSSYGATDAISMVNGSSSFTNPVSGTVAPPATASAPTVQPASGAAADIVARPDSVLHNTLDAGTAVPGPNDAVQMAANDASLRGGVTLDNGAIVQGDSTGGGLINRAPGAPSVQVPGADANNPVGMINGGTPPSQWPQPATGYSNASTAGLPGSSSAVDYVAAGGAGGGLSGTGPNAVNSSAWKDVLGFMNDQKLIGPALMAGASFLSGATSSLTPAQVQALEAQAEANRAAAALGRQQLSNIQSGVPVGRRTGIINRPAPVTRVPA